MRTELKVKGLHCSSCKMLIKDVAEDFSEVISCQVDIKNGKVILEHEKGFNLDRFKRELEELRDYKVI